MKIWVKKNFAHPIVQRENGQDYIDYIVNGFKEPDAPVEDHNKPWMVKLALRLVNFREGQFLYFLDIFNCTLGLVKIIKLLSLYHVAFIPFRCDSIYRFCIFTTI